MPETPVSGFEIKGANHDIDLHIHLQERGEFVETIESTQDVDDEFQEVDREEEAGSGNRTVSAANSDDG